MVRESGKAGTAVLTILLLILLAITACGGGSDETTEPISTMTPTSDETPEVSETPVPTKTITPESMHTPVMTETPRVTPAPTPTEPSAPEATPSLTPVPNEKTTPMPTETPTPEAEAQMCSFNGYVAIDDAGVPDGTVISAWVDGALIGSAATESSAYEMTISGDYTGKAVTFKIGSYKATQTSIWENGAVIVVGLSVRLGPPVCGFYGTVTHQGGNVPDGTTVAAFVDGTVVGSTTVTSSWYYLLLTGEYSGKAVNFRIGSDQALETSTWERGGNENVDLTVVVP